MIQCGNLFEIARKQLEKKQHAKIIDEITPLMIIDEAVKLRQILDKNPQYFLRITKIKLHKKTAQEKAKRKLIYDRQYIKNHYILKGR